jgi:hypothetical protein
MAAWLRAYSTSMSPPFSRRLQAAGVGDTPSGCSNYCVDGAAHRRRRVAENGPQLQHIRLPAVYQPPHLTRLRLSRVPRAHRGAHDSSSLPIQKRNHNRYGANCCCRPLQRPRDLLGFTLKLHLHP